jgi:hypothetical protein
MLLKRWSPVPFSIGAYTREVGIMQTEMRTFRGTYANVLSELTCCLEEAKDQIEAEVRTWQIAFGLIPYRLNRESDKSDLASAEMTIIRSEKYPEMYDWDQLRLFDETDLSTNIRLLKEWSKAYPSWVALRLEESSFRAVGVFGVTPPIQEGDHYIIDPRFMIECLVFRSVCPGTVPLILIDGTYLPPVSNSFSVVEVAPDESLLYFKMKAKISDTRPVNYKASSTLMRRRRCLQ